MFELFVVDGTAATPAPVKVSGNMIAAGNVGYQDFSISPNSQFVVYLADQDVDGAEELYFGDLSSGTPAAAVKLNPNVVSGGAVHTWQWSNDSSQIAFEGDIATDQIDELFFSTVSGGTPAAAVRAHPPAASTADVIQYAWQQ